MSVTLTILTMVFVFLVLLAASGVQAVLTYLLIRENRRLTNGRSVTERLTELSSAQRAVERDVLGLQDLVATFGNRVAVRTKRARARAETEEPASDDALMAQHPELFGGGVNESTAT